MAAPPAVASVVLLHMRGSRVDAAVLAQTNREEARLVWGRARGCERTDLYFARVRYASDHDGSCAYAAYVRSTLDPDNRIDPAWSMARQTAAAKGWAVPASWVDVAFRVTDPRDVVQVRYCSIPGAPTVGAASADRQPGPIAGRLDRGQLGRRRGGVPQPA